MVYIWDIKMNESCQLNVFGSSQHTSPNEQSRFRGFFLSYTLWMLFVLLSLLSFFSFSPYYELSVCFEFEWMRLFFRRCVNIENVVFNNPSKMYSELFSWGLLSLAVFDCLLLCRWPFVDCVVVNEQTKIWKMSRHRHFFFMKHCDAYDRGSGIQNTHFFYGISK